MLEPEVKLAVRLMKKMVGKKVGVMVYVLFGVRVVFVSQRRSRACCYRECRAPIATHPIYHTQLTYR